MRICAVHRALLNTVLGFLLAHRLDMVMCIIFLAVLVNEDDKNW